MHIIYFFYAELLEVKIFLIKIKHRLGIDNLVLEIGRKECQYLKI